MRDDNTTEHHAFQKTTRLSYGLLIAPWIITGLGEFLGVLWYVYALMIVPFAAFVGLVLAIHHVAATGTSRATLREKMDCAWEIVLALLALLVFGAVPVWI